MMKNNYLYKTHEYNLFLCVGMSIILLSFFGSCGRIPENENEVIRAGKSVITTEYINQVIEITKASYPSIESISTNQMQRLRKKVIEELVEEVLIIERARELNLSVTAEELESTITGIRKDYPDDTFETMLLEQAISYVLWKKRLKVRVLVEKTIAWDLQQNITITDAEISAFHQDYPKQTIPPHSDHPLKSEKVQIPANTDAIKKFLKNEKSEALYPAWIKGLKERYGLHINEDLI
ncbi:MAG: SurA N-terminal domain-containing protein [Candidatus Magnetomorum sp.]|nr:SurA N-terminal domain-containing protein [Candidatus Magnetomorum sp.]